MHNGYIFAQVTKGVYGIPQAGQIVNYALIQQLEPYGYLPSIKTPGEWTQDSHSINITLLVDDSWVKYSGKVHALHLKTALEYNYKVTT